MNPWLASSLAVLVSIPVSSTASFPVSSVVPVPVVPVAVFILGVTRFDPLGAFPWGVVVEAGGMLAVARPALAWFVAGPVLARAVVPSSSVVGIVGTIF